MSKNFNKGLRHPDSPRTHPLGSARIHCTAVFVLRNGNFQAWVGGWLTLHKFMTSQQNNMAIRQNNVPIITIAIMINHSLAIKTTSESSLSVWQIVIAVCHLPSYALKEPRTDLGNPLIQSAAFKLTPLSIDRESTSYQHQPYSETSLFQPREHPPGGIDFSREK